MANRCMRVLAKQASHPFDPFPLHDMVGIDHAFQVGDGSDVAADDNLGVRRDRPGDFAHPFHLADIGHDGGDTDDVVGMGRDLAFEDLQGREIEHRAGHRDVRLDETDAQRGMKHPK